MVSALNKNTTPIDVAIIGGGPSGLAAAQALKGAGVERVVVLEREQHAGGIPRSCGHLGFGMREFRRILKGPNYAARLVEQALQAGVEIHTSTTVVEIHSGGALSLSSPMGLEEIVPRRVIYATGVREKPRSARLISGSRVQGVVNTGALQSLVYLKNRRPFTRPVIIGSELVSFSALMTCSHAGIRPVAMLEAGPGVTARWPSALFPLLKGVNLLTNTQVVEIKGNTCVEEVIIAESNGRIQSIKCDGVVLTGLFTPESGLARCGPLDIDPATGGPRVDQWGRCSDPAYFAAGNVLRPVETAGRSWAEGRQAGVWVARDLAGSLPAPSKPLHIVTRDSRLKYAMPQLIQRNESPGGMQDIQMRVTERVSGKIVARSRDQILWSRRLNARPERRITVPIDKIASLGAEGSVEFEIETCLD